MTLQKWKKRAGLTIGTAVLLLLLGLVIDLGAVNRQLGEYEDLKVQREQLRRQLTKIENQSAYEDRLAGYFAGMKGDSLAIPAKLVDPIDFLAGGLRKSNLKRLELRTEKSSQTGQLTRNRYFLRANGSYNQIIDFFKWLERGGQLSTIDAFSIEPIIDSSDLELRLNLSIYDPRMES
ncbi:MAG: hypothetical protein KJ970_17100 [Candidatus Eisenbacteria bacterium]|uniref:Uncharacterized protein n=1 Tax=Eiseniibacteriota bacterium TaxID=2212470 RepID=A0A948W7U7_UNCEI|nr:hypothetical protein [Candidatus Eisenbacteria bacterium]MBU1950628.1 hypothetical protein [Candidatus Eisenbacteria bacterium]MBU2692635.1 hypothetical protein [Candidatus Eisenbacteria bacterium]